MTVMKGDGNTIMKRIYRVNTVALKQPKFMLKAGVIAVILFGTILFNILQSYEQTSIFKSWDTTSSLSSLPTILTTETKLKTTAPTYRKDPTEYILKQQHRQNDISYPFTFAACLQTKDDTLILPEWLAYHYTVLPLRHLIVAIDPLSITTPEPIFEKFRSIGMTIEVWTGNWYFIEGKWVGSQLKHFDPKNYTKKRGYDLHLTRQSSFYTNCLKELRGDPNLSWVAIVDTDEYITYNTFLPMEKEEEEEKKKERARIDFTKSENNSNNNNNIRKRLPQIIGKQNETIAHYIANQWKVDGASSKIMRHDSLCTVFPRINFVAKDVKERENNNNTNNNNNGDIDTAATLFSNDHNALAARSLNTSCILPPTARRPKLPKGFNLEQFHTLRFPFHGPTKHRKEFPGKALVNLKNYNGQDGTTNPHRPFGRKCDNEIGPSINGPVFYPFRVHHYSGSLETFISRPERTEDMWFRKNKFINDDEKQSHQYDDSLVDWFAEFVSLVGRDKAFELTQQAHEQAHQEYKEMKRKYNDTVPPPIFEWGY